MKQINSILILIFLCSSVIFGQEKFQHFLPKVDISQIWHSTAVPEHSMAYDPLIDDIINQTNLDSLIAYVRILSGEDSVWINGSKVRIQHRISSRGNDLAADYIKTKLETYNLEVYDQVYSINGRNIYAVQPGYLYPEKQYIICAHYDAVDNYCADDNASGVAAVLEAARILSRYDFKYSLIYAFWDEEEIGLIGSYYYASQAKSNQTEIQGVLNIDMIGWDGNQDGLTDIHTRNIASSNTLANLLFINDALYDLPLSPVIYNPGTWRSDHSSFWEYGYGAILLIEAYYGDDLNPYYHSSEDRIDKFDLTYFHNLSKLSISAISTLIEITEDTLLIAVSPDKGYRTYTTDIVIKGIHTSFMVNQETLEVGLSQYSETIQADSVVVQSNTSLTAFFYIPKEASTGLWDVNVETNIDGVLKKENSFEILPSPALMFVSPDSLNVSVESGDIITHALTIHNNGASDLNFDILSQGQNHALQFDGIDDYVEIPDVINDGEFSIELWFNLVNDDGGYLYSATKPPIYFDLSVNKTNIHWQFESANDHGGDIIISGLNLTIGEWYHLVATGKYSSNGPHKLFLNGLEIGSNNSEINYKGILNTGFIGRARDFDYHFGVPNLSFGGIIDEVRIWDKVLTLQEIQTNMHNNLTGSEPGLVGYWNFNEAAGDKAFDLSGNGNHGSLQGGVTWVPDAAPFAPEWLTVVPDTGICAVGSTVEIMLYFDASELDPGEYLARLVLSSNDPFNPVVNIPIHVTVTETTDIVQNSTFPIEFKLNQNYPNPFNPSTRIKFALPKPQEVKIEIYNTLGQKVDILLDQHLEVGYHEVEFNAQNLSSGIYFYRIDAGEFQDVKKMILLR